jgi:hypothetical protein
MRRTTGGTSHREVPDLILISLAVEIIGKGPSRTCERSHMEKAMHPLGLLIVELETARRSLPHVFEVPNGTPTGMSDSEIIELHCLIFEKPGQALKLPSSFRNIANEA